MDPSSLASELAGQNPRVIFFGSRGMFSYAPLTALLAANVDLRAVVLPAESRSTPVRRVAPPLQRSPLPLVDAFVERTSAHLAWQRGVPLFEVGNLRSLAALDLFASLQADVTCVACFPWRIPAELLALPRHGFLNLHPSLLPQYRGPEPLFWIFRDGAPAGVTVHFMDGSLDTGDIVAQEPVHLPDGISGSRAELLCAEQGARLLVEALRALQAGSVRRRPQSGGGFRGWPSAGDFRIDTCWSARRAFNFMRGTAEWEQPYTLTIGGERLLLVEALSFDMDQTIKTPYVISTKEVIIQFASGILQARIA